MKPYVDLTPYYLIKQQNDELMPKLLPFHHGLRAPLGAVVRSTLERLPEDFVQALPCAATTIEATFIFGFDGSGSHQEYNSESSLREGVDTSHFMVCGLALSKVVCTDDYSLIYFDKKLSSSTAERPIIICPGREDRSLVQEIFEVLDSEVDAIQKQPLKITYKIDDRRITREFSVKMKMSQLDGKCINVGTGCQGSYCSMCHCTETEGKQIERIEQKFSIERCVASTKALYESLVQQDKWGNEFIPTTIGDYDKRLGLTQKPLTTQDLHQNIPVTHGYLRFLDHIEKVLYRKRAGVTKMGKGLRINDRQKERILRAKESVRQEARYGPLSLKLDCPDPYGSGGNCDTAELARRFFKPENRNFVVDLFKPKTERERSSIGEMLQKISIVLRIISSKEKILPDLFNEHCMETYIDMVKLFPWQTIPPSIHRILAHSAEAIELNDNFGLGMLTEEGLEALHKLLRRYRERRARKCSLISNIFDVFRHLFLRSDPKIRKNSRKFQCTGCKEDGHTKRSCPLVAQKKAEGDEEIFKSFLAN